MIHVLQDLTRTTPIFVRRICGGQLAELPSQMAPINEVGRSIVVRPWSRVRLCCEEYVEELGGTLSDNGRMVMFSGGRDSTLAAVRSAADGIPLTLVTVTSSHLIGLNRVKKRLKELAGLLPEGTRWVQVVQPSELHTDMSFYAQTCLSCHHAYVVACAALAKAFRANRVVFGYVGYQSHWPEQTPLAISSLQRTLDRYGLQLELPVYDIRGRDEAVAELKQRGLSGESLEQKCMRQISNVTLTSDQLAGQIARWERAIDSSLSALELIAIAPSSEVLLSDLVEEYS